MPTSPPLQMPNRASAWYHRPAHMQTAASAKPQTAATKQRTPYWHAHATTMQQATYKLQQANAHASQTDETHSQTMPPLHSTQKQGFATGIHCSIGHGLQVSAKSNRLPIQQPTATAIQATYAAPTQTVPETNCYKSKPISPLKYFFSKSIDFAARKDFSKASARSAP